MADDDDFDYDGELDDEVDADGEEEVDDDDEDEDEEDNEDDEEEQVQKAVVNNKLKKLQKNVETRPLPIYLGNEKQTLKQGKKVNPALTKSIEAKMLVKKANFARNAITIGGPVLIGIAVIFAVVLLILIIGGILTSFFGDGNSAGGSPSGDNSFALNGEQIYSARVIYTDDTMAKNRLVADYGKLIADAITQYNTGNNSYDIAISLPTPQGYDYSLLFDGYSSNEYAYKQLAELTYIFAENVNREYGVRGDTSSYAELLDDIQYFGLEQQAALSATKAVADRIVMEPNWYTKVDEDAQSIDSDALADELMQTISGEVGVISEKVFVADYQLDGKKPLPWLLAGDDDEHLTRQYKAIVYFPKKDLEFNMASYFVVTKKLGEIIVYNGSESYNLTAKLVNDNNYSYEAENINFTAQKTEASAVDIGEGGTVADLYSQLNKANAQAEIEKFFKVEEIGGRQVYKFVPSGFYAEFTFDAPFDVCDNNNLYS